MKILAELICVGDKPMTNSTWSLGYLVLFTFPGIWPKIWKKVNFWAELIKQCAGSKTGPTKTESDD